jgi:hypothetical protein
LIRDVYKLALIGFLALGVFALWFALDPNPQAVWNEFVLGENVGKFSARSTDYFLDLVRGGDSIWMLAITTLGNAGLFAFVLISTFLQCWRERRFLSNEEVLLLLLTVTFFVVFSFPSQRSGRYLLPVMPAFAALIALRWERLPLWGFRIALFLQLVVLSILLWIGLILQGSSIIDQARLWSYAPLHWVFIVGSIVIVLIGLVIPTKSKTIALLACFLSYGVLTSSLGPLEGGLGRFSTLVIEQVKGKDVWIPCDYRAKDEEYRLLMPGAKLHGYPAQEAGDIETLTSQYSLVAVHAPLGSKLVICEGCKVIGERMEMRARHSDEEIKEMVFGKLAEHLFVIEYLVASPAPHAEQLNVKDACR